MELELELVMVKPASRSARFLWLSSTLGPGEGPKKGQGWLGYNNPSRGKQLFVRAQTTDREHNRQQSAEQCRQEGRLLCSARLCSIYAIYSVLLYLLCSALLCSALLRPAARSLEASQSPLIFSSEGRERNESRGGGTRHFLRLAIGPPRGPTRAHLQLLRFCTHSGSTPRLPYPRITHKRIGYPAKSPFEVPPSV